ncbi:MAG TPA: hypothetical protein VJ754_08450, partial [Anaerolineae bacterium]|nr:hypothetical protein [Anaerolineae bacterium]
MRRELVDRQRGELLLQRSGRLLLRDLITHEREWRELPESIRTAADRVASIESRRTEEAARADEVVRQQAALADDVRGLGESAAAQAAARTEALRQIESIDLEREWKNRLIEQAETELRE